MQLRYSDRSRGFSDEDAPFLKAWRDCARTIGLDVRQTEGFIDAYAATQHRIDTVEALGDWFGREATALRITDQQLEVIGTWADQVEERGPESTFITSPQPGQDIARRNEIDEILRTDPGRYWRDERLQAELYDLEERLHAPIEEPAAPQPAAQSRDAVGRVTKAEPNAERIAAIEAMIPDQRSEYWRGDQAEALQAEYRTLIAPPAPAAEGSGQ